MAVYIENDKNVEFFDSYGKEPEHYSMIYSFFTWHATVFLVKEILFNRKALYPVSVDTFVCIIFIGVVEELNLKGLTYI